MNSPVRLLTVSIGLSAAFAVFPPLMWAQTSSPDQPLSTRERAAHLLSRFSFGPAPGEIEHLLEIGEQAWLDEQFSAGPDLVLADMLGSLESIEMSIAEIRDEYNLPAEENESNEDRRARQRLENVPRQELLQSVAMRAINSRNQLEEVLCDFWRNHLNVSFTKGGPSKYFITEWENEVIRANARGSFPAMLRLSAHHPAMLHYLDNSSSRRPPSKQELREIERRTRRRTGSSAQGEAAVDLALQRGLNENYARELLELHTLGVDNYYKQKDVVALAEILTGWTFSGGRNGTFTFEFRNNMHVPDKKRFLGKTIKSDRKDGQAEGEQVLENLVMHKGTAQFIAMKMVRYFVADEPPESLVKDLTRTYTKTDGDIEQMVRTIVASDEFWSRENYRCKFKTPWEFLVSSLRVVGAETDSLRAILKASAEMSQPLYQCDDPTGWYDTAEAWLDPGVMALRWQAALDFAYGRVRGVSVPDHFWDAIPENVLPRLWQHHLTRLVLPGGAGERTRAALGFTTDAYLKKARVPDVRELGPQLLGLLLGSPEFQQQ